MSTNRVQYSFEYFKYTVILDTVIEFTSSWTVPATTDEFVLYNDVLEPNTKYYWRIKTVTDIGTEATRIAPPCYFITGTGTNNPPSMVPSGWPRGDEEGIAVDTLFTWECFDPDGDPLSYDLWYQEDGDAKPTDVSGLTEQRYPVTLRSDSHYRWKVYARDTNGGVDSTAANLFYTVTTDPPFDPTPKHRSGGHPVPLQTSWTCTDPDGGALTYDVSRGLSGANLVRIAEGLTVAQLEMSDLDYDTAYDWQVTAEDTDGHRFAGPVWSFSTGSDPGTYDGVYAEFTVHRTQIYSGTELTRIDHMSARFDSLYAPDGPINPLRPTAVEGFSVGIPQARDLVWDDSWDWYYYNNSAVGYFLGSGQEYFFTVTPGDGVPALSTDPIVFPECGPYITSPAPYSSVSTLEGLEVVWVGDDSSPGCNRPVTIRIQDMGFLEWTDVNIQTWNVGSYTFTSADAALIDPSIYQIQIVLIVDNKEGIIAPGYDRRSWVWARTYATQFVYLQ